MPGKGYYKRAGDKTYTVEFQYRRRRVSARTQFRTEGEVKQWIAAKKKEIDLLQASPVSKSVSHGLKVGEALALYWERKLSLARSATVSKRYQLQTIGAEIGTEIRLEDLSTADVAAYVAARLAAPKKRRGCGTVAPATVKSEVAILKAAHNWARDVLEYPVRNIAWRTVTPKLPDVQRPSPTLDDVRALLAAAPTDRLRNVILFASLTGFRRSEIRNLVWDNLNFQTNAITVNGKGGKVAILPMSQATRSLLISMQDDKSQRIFDMANFRNEWNTAREKSGRKNIVFHDLRHFFATSLGNQGAPVQRIAAALRHSDVSTSLIYTETAQSALLPHLETLGSEIQAIYPIENSSPHESRDGNQTRGA